jgi:hypothetical protein
MTQIFAQLSSSSKKKNVELKNMTGSRKIIPDEYRISKSPDLDNLMSCTLYPTFYPQVKKKKKLRSW